jgi:hypothetical protein
MKTLAELEADTRDFVSPADVAQIIGIRPYAINLCARDNPEALGFPVVRVNSRVRIPRLAFIKFVKGE